MFPLKKPPKGREIHYQKSST